MLSPCASRLFSRLRVNGCAGSQLRLWPDAGHMYIIDEPRADREIARFLLHHSAVWSTV